MWLRQWHEKPASRWYRAAAADSCSCGPWSTKSSSMIAVTRSRCSSVDPQHNLAIPGAWGMNPANFVESRVDGDVLVITPLRNIGSMEHEATQLEWQALLKQLNENGPRHAVLDFNKIAYFGSAVLEYLVLLYRHLQTRQGKLAVCNLSDIGSQVLQTTRF